MDRQFSSPVTKRPSTPAEAYHSNNARLPGRSSSPEGVKAVSAGGQTPDGRGEKFCFMNDFPKPA